MSNELHPIFAGILEAIQSAPAKVGMAEYQTALATFDWSHEFSDDQRKYQLGREQLKNLRRLQPIHDPDGSIWRAAMPQGYGLPTPLVELHEFQRSVF